MPSVLPGSTLAVAAVYGDSCPCPGEGVVRRICVGMREIKHPRLYFAFPIGYKKKTAKNWCIRIINLHGVNNFMVSPMEVHRERTEETVFWRAKNVKAKEGI